ncbi:Ig-like domain-containing protein [Aeromonas enteropelogenes]|uniref:Ig-like domain-containing protein n=6 Tax=Aeromonas enteropelogenes TaxID=29489 RepID=UPI001CCF09D9|nr:Ig-like domain-containing protein [Aeromonas enteropelogenes]UBH28893.1 Ig-like domain-containing protein [Aeromonas enteropelogenes]
MITNSITLAQGVTVTQLKGEVYLLAADGSRKLLAEGDVVPKGAVIISPEGGSFLGGEQQFTLSPAEEPREQVQEAETLLAQNGTAGAPDDINALQQAILGGADPTQTFEASAAGGAPAAGGGVGGVAGASGNGGFVTIDRTGDTTISQAGFDTTYNTNAEPPRDALGGEEQTFDLTAPSISVVAPDNSKDTTPTITGTTDAVPGSTITLIVTDANGKQQTLTATVQPDGSFSVDVVVPLPEGGYDVTASVTDPVGNTSTATDNGSVDVTAPVITVEAPDNTNDTTPSITGTTDAAPGSTITLVVTDANGNQQTLTATVQPDGSYSTDVVTPLPDGDYDVIASVTDPAGNKRMVSDNGSVDTTANITVSLDDVNADNAANAPITGSSDIGPGRTVTLVITDAKGGKVTVTAVTDANGNYNTKADLSGLTDGNLTVEASATDGAGNRADARDDTTLFDTTPPVASITLDGNITADDVINAAESKQDIAVTGTVGGDVKVGDTVTLIVNGKTFTGLVLADKTFSINVPGADLVADSDKVIDASVTTTDAAGNSATATDNEGYGVDTTAPDNGTTTISVNDVTADNVINAAESGQNISVSGTVSGEFKAGDVVTLTINGTDYTTTVNAAGEYSVDVAGRDLAADTTIDAKVAATDAAGNVGEASTVHSHGVDTEVTASITLDGNITADDVINATEAGQQIPVTGTVGGDVKVGDTVTLIVNGKTFTGLVLADKTFSINVPGADLVADADKTIDASVTTTDAAGNSATATDNEGYGVDTTAPDNGTTTISVNDVTADNVINAAESGQNISVSGTVSGEFKAGDVVTLTINGTDYTTTVNAAGEYSVDVAGRDLAADTTIDAKVAATDAAGNVGEASTVHSHGVDTEVTASITLDGNITADDVINATEAGQQIPVTGTVGGDVKVGDTVTLIVNGKTFTGLVLADKTFSINVPGADLVADADKTIDASVTTTDAAGNSATATDNEGYGVDTTAPDNGTTTISVNDVTADNVINAAESGQNISVSGTVSGEFKAGDVVTLTINGTDYTTTVNAAGEYSVDVAGRDLAADTTIDAKVAATDAAGNVGEASTVHSHGVDTEVTASITLDGNITADDVINATEAGQQIPVTGTVGGDVKVGDTVTLIVNGKTFTGLVLADKTFSINVPGADLVADADKTIDASVTTTDAAGNSATATDNEGYGVDTTAPDNGTTTISVNDVTADNVINAAESGQNISVSGTVSGEFKAGDVVTLTINGTDYTTTVNAAGEYSVDVAGRDLAADTTIDAKVAATDAAGNVGEASTVHSHGVDTEVTASITLDGNITADDVINATEAGQQIPVTGTVGGDVKVGDTVTLIVNGKTFTGLVLADKTFSINVPGADLVADADKTIDASVTTTDAAGNSATATDNEGYGVDTTAPDNGTTTISVNDVTADNVINAAESGQNISVSGTVSGEFKAGDVVTLTINGTDYTTTVNAAGEYSVDVAGRDLAADTTIDAKVAATDAAGNVGEASTVHSHGVDTEVTASITLDGNITADDVINATEAGQQIPVTGTVGGDVKVGDTVTLIVNGKTFTGLVLADKTFSINVPGADLVADADKTIDASVTTTDAAGNSATATDNEGYGVDTTAPDNGTTTISVNDVTADNVINAAESGQNISVSGTVSGEFKAGDVVTLTINGTDYTTTVNAAGEYSVDVAGRDLAADTTIDAKVAATDAAGNVGEASTVHSHGVDTEVTASITLDGNITADDVINATEAGQQIPVTGTVGGDVKVGDTVTLIVNGKTFTGLVLADKTFSINVPGADLVADADKTIDASVTTTDTAGNSATATDNEGYGVDTTAPDNGTTTISVNDVTADNVINAAESGQNISVSGTVSGEFKAGDVVTLTINGTDYTTTVNAAGEYSVDVAGRDLAADTTIDAKVAATDAAGNVGEASTVHSHGVDTEVTASITLDGNITADDVINATEAGQQIPVTGTVGGDVKAGDTVTLTVNGKTFTGLVLADKTFSINVPGADLVADADKTIDASVTTTDAAGNSATATDNEGYGVDTTAPDNGTTTISVNDVTADNVINAAESGQNISVSGTVSGEFKAGDVVTLTINGTDYTTTVNAAGEYSVDVAGRDLAADTTIDAKVAATDAAGNVGEASTVHSHGVDTEVTASITLDGNITADDVINAAESAQEIAVTGTVGGDVKAGDTVTLTVNGKTFTGTVAADKTFSINVPGADLVADADKTIDASVTTTDAAGNSATATDNEGYGVDTTAPDNGTTTISVNDVTADNVINAAESGQNISVSGTVSGEFKAGDVVTLTINGTDYTTTVNAAGEYSVDVAGRDLAADTTIDAKVAATDAAGNVGEASTVHSHGVDTEVTASITLDGNITADDVINATEAGQQIPVTGTVGGDVKVGDTVTLIVNGKTFTGLVLADKTFSINVPGADLVADADKTIDASVTTTDAAGNSATATDNEGYGVDTTAPDNGTTTISVNDVTADNVINAAESGQNISVSGTVSGEFKAGDVVTLTINGTDYTTTVNAAGEYSVDVAGRDLAADTTIDAKVAATDAAGNVGEASTVHSHGVDTEVTASITLDGNITADDVINAAESAQEIAVTGTVGGDVKAGDTVTLTVNGKTFTGTVAADKTFSINVPGADLVADADKTIDASVTTTDAAGNSATATDNEGYGVDTTAPDNGTTTISVNDVTADNVINAAESGQNISVSGTVSGEFKAGDVVTLTINGTDYTTTVNAAGEYSVDVAGRDLAADTTIDAKVAATDAAGNVGEASTVHSHGVDTEVTASITLDGNITADDVINATEAGQQIPVTGTVGGDVKVGDTVTLIVNGKTFTGLVLADKTFSINVPGADLVADADKTIDASVTTTDAAGNSATATDNEGYGVDTTAPDNGTTTISVNDVTADNVINAAESGQNISVSGTVSGEFKAGDVVTLTINGTDYTTTVNAAGEYSVDVAGRDLAADTTIDAKVAATDAAGNVGEASTVHSHGVDTEVTASITLDGNITADDVINATEAGQQIPVTGTVGGDVKVGDTVTLIVNGKTFTGTVAADKTFSINVPGADLVADADKTIDASVTTTDAAGNSATATDNEGYGVDTTAPDNGTTTISVNDVTADNVINAAESGQNISVSGTVSGEFKAGDVVTLTINGTDYTTTVNAAGEYSVDVAGRDLAADTTIDAKVAATDAAGNVGEASTVHSHGVDTEVTASITLDGNITADDVINAAESAQEIAVTGTVGGDVKAGDTVTLTVNGKTFTGTVAADKTFSINVPGADLVADADKTIDASVTTTDAAGNSATATDNEGYGVDTTAPDNGTTTISVNDVTADNVINAAESGQNISVSGTVSGEFKAGDVVTLTINGTDYTTTVNAAGEYSVDVAGRDLAADTTIDAKVAATDAAGNVGEASTVHSHGVDTEVTASITLDGNITADDVINATEAGQQIPVTGTVGGDVKVGDTVTLIVNGKTFTGLVLADKTFSINVPGADLVADADKTIDASVTTTDAAGNSATATDNEGYGVDTTAPDNGTTTISVNDVTADNVINAAESGQNISVSGTVSGEFKAGDVVTLTINGTDYTTTVNAAGEYSVDVAGRDLAADTTIDAKVAATDAAGNVGEASTVHSHGVDTEVTASITLDGNITADDVINAAESAQEIAVTGTVGGDVKAGDTVTLTVNGKTFTGTVAADKTFSINVPGADLVADADKTIDASVTTTDAAGNSATATDNEGYGVDTTAPDNGTTTISVNDVTADNVINAAESGQNISVSGTVSGEFKAGDVVTLTINGTDYTTTVNAAGEYSVDVAGRDLAADTTIDAKVAATDAAGNVGEASTVHSHGVDTEVTASITLDGNITADDVINATEAGQQIPVTGTVGGDVKVGDTVTLIVNGKTFTGLVLADKTFSINVPGADLVADSDKVIDAKVTTTDAAGNSTTATDNEGYGVDTMAASTPTVTIVDDSNNDQQLTKAEIGNDQVQVRAVINHADLLAGGKVTLTINNGGVNSTVQLTLKADGTLLASNGKSYGYQNGTISWTETTPANGKSLTVTATQTDKAGNVSLPGSDTAMILNEAPNTADKQVRGQEDSSSIAIPVLSGSDIDGTVVSFTIKSLPANGTLYLNGAAITVEQSIIAADAGKLTFKPDANWNGDTSFKYVAIDNDGLADQTPATVTIKVEAVNDAPTLSIDKGAVVSEEGLAGALPDSQGSVDTTNSVVASGKLVVQDADSSQVSVTLNGPTGLTSGGSAITWSMSGQTLIGSANGKPVLEVKLTPPDATGKGEWSYQVTLKGPVDHPVAGQEDTLRFELDVNVSDGQSVTTGKLPITIEDDSPMVVTPQAGHIDGSGIQTNLMLIVDVSGSMDYASGVPGKTRLDIAKESLISLLNTYDSLGSTKVRIVTFSSEADDIGERWMTVTEAKTYVWSLRADGGTNYKDAINESIDAFADPGKLTGQGVQNVSYFFSDGEPWANYGIPENKWLNFLKANDIKSFALGMGSQINQDALNLAAYDGVSEQNTDAIVVTDMGKLDQAISGTVQREVSGDLFGQAGTGAGADGGAISTVRVDGHIYAIENGRLVSGAAQGGSYDAQHQQLMITLGNGDKLTIGLVTGEYLYQTSQHGAQSKIIGFDLVDADGDKATGSLAITIEPSDNGRTFAGNDGDDHLTVLNDSQVHIALGGVHGGGPQVMIEENIDTRSGVTLYGGQGYDHLTGGQGEDILIGGTNGHGSSGPISVGGKLYYGDVLTGGDGADTFQWQLGDALEQGSNNAAMTPDHAIDYITDFNVEHTSGRQQSSNGWNYFKSVDIAHSDKLDLSDMLDHSGSNLEGDISKLLSAFEAQDGVHLQVKSAAGSNQVSQEIVLLGENFSSITGDSNGVYGPSQADASQQVINYMLQNHLLDIDK